MVNASASEILQSVSGRIKSDFDEARTILNYAEWFDLFMRNPRKNLRGAAQYLKDVFDYFGVVTLERPEGQLQRFSLFDAAFNNGIGRVAGQEAVQNEIYRLIANFVRDGRVTKLILLHGPNGSAKSSLVRAIQLGMEHYSSTPEGALYSFAWIFPSETISKGRLGFAQEEGSKKNAQSYAHLSSEEIDARLPCETRDPPLFLLPKRERARLLEQLRKEGKLADDFVISRYLLEGDLGPRDRAIYDALLMANDGDHAAVLRHVQVERFQVSQSYGRAVATVQPQMHVDAEARQITADRSIANLPRALQTVPLYELHGPLVSANRGLLEFADLLKRPVEAFKYLLATSEEATASLPQFKVHLDEVLIASSNEVHLAAFKEYPDWNSFKGRIELVRVPYLLRFQDEVEIYQDQIKQETIDRPLAPHVVEVAAMWACLTRLRWPDPDHYDEPVQAMVKKLTPEDKTKLYNDGTVPAWCAAKDAKELRNAVPKMLAEYRNAANYEGQVGASAREIRTVLLNAAHRPGFKCLTPVPLIEELHELTNDKTLYEFLRLEPHEGYHASKQFIKVVQDWWHEIVDEEFRTSMGLVEEAQHEDLFSRYVLNVSHFLKKEKVFDRITGSYKDPDQDLMKEVESIILAENEDRDDFRKAVIGRIGAWGLDNQGTTPNYRELFSQHIEKIEDDYYQKQRTVIKKKLTELLDFVSNDTKKLSEDAKRSAENTIKQMESRFGYHQLCTEECAAHLLKARYGA